MDHYQTLGVSKTSTPEEIKKAYRKLASVHHPDKGGNKESFQRIEEAYRVLSDPRTRQQYDNPQPAGFNFNMNGGTFDINEIMRQFFGMQQNNHPQQKIYRTSIWLTLQQAYTGIEQPLNMQTENNNYSFKVIVPPGVHSGQQIRYDSVIPNASIIIEYHVHKDLKFERKNNDLFINYAISVLDLIVGKEIEIETIQNKLLKVTIPPYTQPNSSLRVGNHGMPVFNSSNFGDMYIVMKPFTPSNVSDDIINAIKKSN